MRIVDAFTDRPYAGNPAAVCLLDGESWPPQRWLEQVAAELSVPMTAFGHRLPARGGADWALRWFLPTGIEEDLCGHATLAAAHVLRSDGAADGTIRFSTRSGVLLARAADDTMITLDFPAAPVTGSDAPADLAVALGAEPVATYRADKLRDLLVVLPDEAAVRALAPDFAALARLTRREGLRGSFPRRSRRVRLRGTTSCPASSPPPMASPKIQSPEAPTLRWPRTGPAACGVTC